MLSTPSGDTAHQTEDTAIAVVSVPTMDPEFPPAAQQQEAVQELMDVFQGDSFSTCDCSACASPLTMNSSSASPEFNFEDTVSEYLTSPFGDSPFDDDLLQTPLIMDDSGADIYNSPMMGDDWSAPYQGSLFNDPYTQFMQETQVAKQPASAPLTVAPAHIDLNTMWSLSPSTPALEASPLPLPVKPLPTHSRRKSSATGTRKNVTPETLVPIDAPTQSRNYVTPSVTSRKEVPAVFARKRARSQAFGDEQDELEEESVTLPPNPTEADLIEAKRRQNTIAARRSRKRKLEYQRELEDQVDQLKEERDTWKNRAMTYQALLKSHGLAAPDL